MPYYAEAQRNWGTGIVRYRVIPKQKKTRRSGPSDAVVCNVLSGYTNAWQSASREARRDPGTGIASTKKGGTFRLPRGSYILIFKASIAVRIALLVAA